MFVAKTLRPWLAGLALLSASHSFATTPALQLEHYNPGTDAVFPVSSTLVLGEHDALLVDAQFSRKEAAELVKRIQASGRQLTTVYISHGDPDFYFGLEVIRAAYPKAQVLATAETIAHIQASKTQKLQYWGPILKDGAPKTLIVPQPLQGDSLMLEGQALKVIGLPHNPAHTSLWIPSLRTVLGGVLVSANMHVWSADAQRPEERQAWLRSLDELRALQPERVIPGHYLGQVPASTQSLDFTRQYLLTLEQELTQTSNAAELTAAMQRHYPNLAGAADLQLSAKVLKGEMPWP